MPDALVVTRSVRIPRHELQVTFSTSGGPGGQHANRSHTRVELRLDLETSTAFGPVQRQRVIDRFGPEIRVVVEHRRDALDPRHLVPHRVDRAEQFRPASERPPAGKPTR